MDPTEKLLLTQEDTEEDGEDDWMDSYLTNTDPESANLVMEEKVLLARERGPDIQTEEVEEDESEESDGEFITPEETGEKIFISREVSDEEQDGPVQGDQP